MKFYLIAVLFLAALVVVPSLAEEEAELSSPPGGSTTGLIKEDEVDFEEPADKYLPEEDSREEENEIDDDEEDEGQDEVKDDDIQNDEIPEELRDEVVQAKRAFPQLSSGSCRILKRYGYCRTPVKRFCLKQCNGCNNRLSHQSCNLIKNKYKRCNKVGRAFCRKTCGFCGKPLPKQCTAYSRLNQISRRRTRNRGNLLLCDNKLREGWYRFTGQAGNKMPTSCKAVPSNRCGTHATGYLVGSYPRVRGQTVTRQVCFHWNKNCCYNAKWWKIYIQVTNCGGYFVHYLRKPKACYYRYCGNF